MLLLMPLPPKVVLYIHHECVTKVEIPTPFLHQPTKHLRITSMRNLMRMTRTVAVTTNTVMMIMAQLSKYNRHRKKHHTPSQYKVLMKTVTSRK